ncbi:MAG: hypothetical protein E1N59_970 [Puniceicoccaceae bacterium 5H]|nr:MAG: hypothetical protein E1N59_970 [Puniceicoccaceae bacterium 5H]
MKQSLLLLSLLPVGLFGQSIFNDDFSDGLAAATGSSDTNWYKTTSNGAYEEGSGYLGLVSGTSGRGIHTTFGATSLGVGDSIRATFTFNTPDTIGSDRSSSLRFGLFNSNSLDASKDYTDSTSPDWDVVTGYMGALDVNMLDGSDTGAYERIAPSGTGANERLLGTTAFFDNLDSGGSDFTFYDNATYTGTFTLQRLDENTISISTVLSILGGGELTSFTVADASASETTFDIFGLHVNSNSFGSSNTPGEDDNGIDITEVSLDYIPGAVVPEPSTYAAFAALAALGFVGYRRRKQQ